VPRKCRDGSGDVDNELLFREMPLLLRCRDRRSEVELPLESHEKKNRGLVLPRR